MDLPTELLALLKQPSTCYIATTMPDGSPQLTQVWCDTDDEHILINTVEGHQKARNIHRDPWVAFDVADLLVSLDGVDEDVLAVGVAPDLGQLG